MRKLQDNLPVLWQSQLPKLKKNSNKYTRGHTVIVGGYPLTGAARLAALAAARAGSGLTTIITPEVAFPIYASALTSIMVRPYKNSKDFRSLVCDSRISAFLIGPGAGVNEETRQHVLTILRTGKSVVLDADAISAFKNDSDKLKCAIDSKCVMTPHEGEFTRLFDLGSDRVRSANNAASTSGAVIVLKGAETIIASPDGRYTVNRNAPPTLATAGSGDVLAGIITSLLAQGMEPFLAASAAVWIHGEAANLFGIGLIAEDLPQLLPKVLQKIC